MPILEAIIPRRKNTSYSYLIFWPLLQMISLWTPKSSKKSVKLAGQHFYACSVEVFVCANGFSTVGQTRNQFERQPAPKMTVKTHDDFYCLFGADYKLCVKDVKVITKIVRWPFIQSMRGVWNSIFSPRLWPFSFLGEKKMPAKARVLRRTRGLER